MAHTRKKMLYSPKAFNGYGPPEPPIPAAQDRPGRYPCPCCGQITFPVPPEEAVAYPGFDYLDIVPVTGTMAIRDSQSLLDLFRMTPYYWRTPRAGAARLAGLEGLAVTAGFRIHVFRREG